MDALAQVKQIDAVKADAHAIGAINGNAIDTTQYDSLAFNVVLSDKGSAGTLDAKLQHSDDGSTDWTDDDGTSKNIKAITQLTANGSARLAIHRPIKKYYRVVITVGTNAVDAYVSGSGIPKFDVPVTY